MDGSGALTTCRRCWESFESGGGKWVSCYMGGIFWGKTELCPRCSLEFQSDGVVSH